MRRSLKRYSHHYLFLTLLGLAPLLAFACSINPQPEPPGATGEKAGASNDAGTQEDAPSFDRDAGAGQGGNDGSNGWDASIDVTSDTGCNDANECGDGSVFFGDGSDEAEADAPADGPSDVLGDSPNDATGDADNDASDSAADAPPQD